MRRRAARPEQARIGRTSRRQHDVHIDARLEETLPQCDRGQLVADRDRDDRRLDPSDGAAESLEPRPQPSRVRPETLAQRRVARDHPERRSNALDHRRRSRCGEDITPCEEPKALELRPVGDAEAADATERLRECPDDEVDVVENTLRLRQTQTTRTVGAERVGFVHQQIGPILVADRDDLLEWGNVAPDGIHALDDDQAIPLPARQSCQLPREILGGVVVEDDRRRAREPSPIEDARVAVRVYEQHVPGLADPGNDGEVRLVARRKDDRVALAEVAGEVALECRMDRQRAVGGARPCRADAVTIHGITRRGTHFRVKGQTEVVVRSEHERPPPANDDFRGAQHLVDRGVTRAGGLGSELRSACPEDTQLIEQIAGGQVPLGHGPSPHPRSRGRISVPAAYRSRRSARRSFPLVVRSIVPFDTRTISSMARPVAWSTRRRTSARKASADTGPRVSTTRTALSGCPGAIAANAATPPARTPGPWFTTRSMSWGK